MDELVIIESYFQQNVSASKISKQIVRARQTVHNVVVYLKANHTVLEYYKRYKSNKKRCGRKRTELPADQHAYMEEKAGHRIGLPAVVNILSAVPDAHCTACSSARPLIFSHCQCREKENPMAKRNAGLDKPSDGSFLTGQRTIQPTFETEFGHLEGDTIVGVHHKSAVVTLVEHLSKVIITLKSEGRTARDIEIVINEWFNRFRDTCSSPSPSTVANNSRTGGQ